MNILTIFSFRFFRAQKDYRCVLVSLTQSSLVMGDNVKAKKKTTTTKFVLELEFRARLPFKRRFAPVLGGVLASSS